MDSQPASAPSAEVPANTVAAYENLGKDVKYVGNAACVACHQEQNQSYEHTAHRHALAEIKLSEEPAPGSYLHTTSNRKYEVVHDPEHQKLIHRESVIGSHSPELTQEHAVRYVIGSGHHSRTYLLELDDYLIESPITWYTNQSQYAMSPGYDRLAHGSFERIADVNCLMCHAGEVSAANGNSFKPSIHQQTIGCESCHGPGEVHLRKHQSKNSVVVAGEDLSIVNPRRLSREANESVCANCHLRGSAAVTLPGKLITSFRPGMLLRDCRVDYQLAESDGGMKVVGHVEQMHLSECYTKSDTMTCTTCHDPHSMVSKVERQKFYMDKCQSCHSSGCPSPADVRLSKVPDNNCVVCHMPQSPTDIPHFAFTHHRIGLHKSTADKPVTQTKHERAGKLTPVFPRNSSAALDKRNLGLAYFELADSEAPPQIVQEYLSRAESLLLETYNSPLRDGEVESVLARLSWERHDLRSAIQLSQSALRHPTIGSRARLNSLFILGESQLQLQDYSQATQNLQTLVKERRLYTDWLLLTLCYSRTGRLDEAARCLQKAIEINPVRREAQEMLIEVYKRQNKPELAQKHADLLKQVSAQAPAKP